MPTILMADEDGEGVDEVVVEVAVAEVTEMSDDSLDGIDIEVDVDESLDNEELEVVLVVVSLVDVEDSAGVEEEAPMEMEVDGLEAVPAIVSLVDVESRVELEDEALLELELDELEAEDLAEDTTVSHFPNPAWQPVPQYALPLPQYEYCEQQSPYFPPEHVIPAGDAPYEVPQRALVVTLTFVPVAEGAVDGAVLVEVDVLMRLDTVEVRAGATTPLQVPNDD
ncbi:hypothetical protein J4E90_005170 [Alternaria incomplexa]|uniref:uncharacterized protein n=1 Tax=Alternaria incomplexa TaxID=1187928 RepID=UPI002220B34D|nr:uncharacterized protein J4E90_005170 [Alternaria incomplexa]KAI4915131.1 hypothetical protein J4E90_005170 [Alternaria incomplexa]